jgi:hypothetical protein
MSAATEGVFTKDVTDILDMFYAGDGAEPDWAAIRTRLHSMEGSYFTVIINLLRAMWAQYEDPANFATIMFRLEQELADK